MCVDLAHVIPAKAGIHIAHDSHEGTKPGRIHPNHSVLCHLGGFV
jgi:hypothetical protein